MVNVHGHLPEGKDQHGKYISLVEAQVLSSVIHLCPRREPRTKLTVTT
jgi:hypothetical protein